MSDDASPEKNTSFLKGMLGNIGWLLGGKGFGAICSIGYLAILSRSLGAKDFGHFSLIFATALALASLAGVRTWQAIAQYGARYLVDADWARFGRLTMLCGIVDAAGSALGCVAAAIVFYGFADELDLNPAYIDVGFAFNCAIVWARVAAPFGVLRVMNRFDLNVLVGAFVPIARLLAAIAIWLIGPSVDRFLFAWAAIDLISAISFWAAAQYVCPHGVKLTYLRDFRQALKENVGILPFLSNTYLSSSISAVNSYAPLLAIGYFLGTSTAGLYRLVDQVAQGVGKLATIIAQGIYSDFALIKAATTHTGFRSLVVRVTLLSGASSTLVVLIALLGGNFLIDAIGGAQFLAAAPVLLPLMIAASFGLAGVAFEPILHSTGHASYALAARVVGLVVLVIAFLSMIGHGILAAGWAVAIGAGAGYLALACVTYLATRHPGVPSAQKDPPADES